MYKWELFYIASDAMWDILNNSWVIGVGGGIVSGLLVFLITKRSFPDPDKRELARNIANANQEVVYSIRSCIPDEKLPSPSVLEALIKATARKYGVLDKKLFDVRDLCQELIKEVMDSSFISADTKEKYCNELNNLGSSIPPPDEPKKPQNLEKEVRGMALVVASAVGSSVVLISYTIEFLVRSGNLAIESPSALSKALTPVLLSSMMAIITFLVGLTTLSIVRRARVRHLTAELEDTFQRHQRRDETKPHFSNVEKIDVPADKG